MLHVTYIITKVTDNILERPPKGKKWRASSLHVTQIIKVMYNNNMSPFCMSLYVIFYIVISLFFKYAPRILGGFMWGFERNL